MDHHGFIHEKLDIKLLILFMLSRLSGPVDRGTLDELCQQCDEGVDYFDYSDCLGELIQSGHVVGDDEEYAITDKGRCDSGEVEKRLPYSVRARALKLLAPVEERVARAALIRADVVKKASGCRLELALSDGKEEMMSLSLRCEDEVQAKAMKRSFRRSADQIYQKIVEILGDEGK
ncbi:MAG: DUF4364 family protein [Oscillospiraceae bacterium]|nr:DUF4364 family protein [Oscillospiraceae bacterium]